MQFQMDARRVRTHLIYERLMAEKHQAWRSSKLLFLINPTHIKLWERLQTWQSIPLSRLSVQHVCGSLYTFNPAGVSVVVNGVWYE